MNYCFEILYTKNYFRSSGIKSVIRLWLLLVSCDRMYTKQKTFNTALKTY